MSMGRPKRRKGMETYSKTGRPVHHCANVLQDTEIREGRLFLRYLCRGCGRWAETPAAVELPKKESA